MSDLVKTGKGKEIYLEILEYSDKDDRHELDNVKFLVLPDGLDVLQKQLNDELCHCSVDVVRIVNYVFARFKKENEI